MLWLAHFGITLVAARLLGAVRPCPWPTWAVLVGAVLPDLIDKPLSLALPSWSGRHAAHSVLFVLLLGLAAWRLPGPWRAVAGALCFGTATHLVLDSMWQVPHALWWPLLGLAVPHEPDSVARYVAFLGGRTALMWEGVGVALIALWSLERARPRAERGQVVRPER